jgi:predicted Holliday junction resolvase-like endonuclease
MEIVEFAETYQYDTRLVGITVPVFLFKETKNAAFKAFVFLKEKTGKGSASKSKAARKYKSAPLQEILRLSDTN